MQGRKRRETYGGGPGIDMRREGDYPTLIGKERETGCALKKKNISGGDGHRPKNPSLGSS